MLLLLSSYIAYMAQGCFMIKSIVDTNWLGLVVGSSLALGFVSVHALYTFHIRIRTSAFYPWSCDFAERFCK